MVSHLLAVLETSEPLLRKLDPQSRVKVVMALLALVVLGLGLVALVALGGRYVRRIARQSPEKSRTHQDDWFRKPLVPKEPDSASADDDE